MSIHQKSNMHEQRLDQEALPGWLVLVRDHVNSLKFGTVQITVHDSRVVQVERAEKVRLDKDGHNTE